VHVLLDHDDYMPSYVLLTEARRHDRVGAHLLSLNAGSIVAMDRAYNDYPLFAEWTAAGIFFVTRLKDNADYEVTDERRVPENSSIRSDQVIRLLGTVAAKKCDHLLRRVVVWDEVNEREIVLLTNHLEFGATTIAAIYRERWQIELFFKTLKQHLKVKTFVGTSENALRIQLWTALIALLLLKWLHYQSHRSWSFSNLAAMLRLNLFTYRDLLPWLKEPFGQRWPPSFGQLGRGVKVDSMRFVRLPVCILPSVCGHRRGSSAVVPRCSSGSMYRFCLGLRARLESRAGRHTRI